MRALLILAAVVGSGFAASAAAGLLQGSFASGYWTGSAWFVAASFILNTRGHRA
jgi:hypothetical protein